MTARDYRRRATIRVVAYWSIIVLMLLVSSFQVGRVYERIAGETTINKSCFPAWYEGYEAGKRVYAKR